MKATKLIEILQNQIKIDTNMEIYVCCLNTVGDLKLFNISQIDRYIADKDNKRSLIIVASEELSEFHE